MADRPRVFFCFAARASAISIQFNYCIPFPNSNKEVGRRLIQLFCDCARQSQSSEWACGNQALSLLLLFLLLSSCPRHLSFAVSLVSVSPPRSSRLVLSLLFSSLYNFDLLRPIPSTGCYPPLPPRLVLSESASRSLLDSSTASPVARSLHTMHFPHSTLALLSIVLVALVSTSAALPTTSRSAATYEPLFRPASPHVGPNRSIERLRQRRANLGGGRPAPPEKRSNVKNPKAKRSAPVTVVVANPKTKRSSSPPASVANVQRRSLIASNPKAKRAVVAASISITAADPVRRSSRFSTVSTLLKRFLGRRGTISTITVGAVKSSSSSSSSASSSSTPLRIPNPKSPKFSSGGDGSSTTTSSSTTTYSSTRSSTSTSATKSATSTTKTTSSSKTSTSTTTSATSTSTGSVFPRSGKQIAGGYYPDWEGDNLKPEDINYKMFDLINYCAPPPSLPRLVSLVGI